MSDLALASQLDDQSQHFSHCERDRYCEGQALIGAYSYIFDVSPNFPDIVHPRACESDSASPNIIWASPASAGCYCSPYERPQHDLHNTFQPFQYGYARVSIHVRG